MSNTLSHNVLSTANKSSTYWCAPPLPNITPYILQVQGLLAVQLPRWGPSQVSPPDLKLMSQLLLEECLLRGAKAGRKIGMLHASHVV